jgi:hypothetical protein
MWQGWAKRLIGLAYTVVKAACKSTSLPETASIRSLQLRLRIWGAGEVTDGTRRALFSMVDVWRPRKNKTDSVLSLRAVEWLSMLQRLAVCVIQDDDAVIPNAEMRRVSFPCGELHVVVTTVSVTDPAFACRRTYGHSRVP